MQASHGTYPAMSSESVTPEVGSQSSRLVFACGILVLLTAFAALLLPASQESTGASIIGTMMIVAGGLETIAGAFRRQHPASTVVPGALTIAAGAAFQFHPFGLFVPAVRLVAAWLAGRAMVLALAGYLASGSLRRWTYVAASVDGLLAATLLLGLSASTFIVALFGPTSQVVASFAWVVGVSFVASGLLLMEIGRQEQANSGS